MASLRRRPPALRRAVCAVVWLAAGTFASGCKDGPPAGAAPAGSAAADTARKGDPTPTERVVAACVEAMVRSTCQVMAGSSTSSSASVIFVAGVGPVDATAYRRLRESGEGMCEVVRSACKSDWEGAQCKASRALWPSATGG